MAAGLPAVSSFASSNRPPLLAHRSGSFSSSVAKSNGLPTVPLARQISASTLSADDAYGGVEEGELDAVSDDEGAFDADTSMDTKGFGQRKAPSDVQATTALKMHAPRRPELPHASSSASRATKGDVASRAGTPMPAKAPVELSPSEALPALPTGVRAMPDAPKTDPASADSLLAYVLSLRKSGVKRTASETSTASMGPAAIVRGQESHSRNESTGSATSVEEELDRSKLMLDMARSASASSLGPSKGKAAGKELSGLESVDLSHRRIASLPPAVLQVLAGHVERLALGYNDLTGLPTELTQLGSSLRYLNVRVNYLTAFPAVLCELPSLEILDISRNKITKLPKASGTLKSLKVLSLSKNRITKLPGWFAEMVALRVLKLDHNPIIFPPREVTSYPLDAGEATADDPGDRKRAKSDDPVMAQWILQLRTWIVEHPGERRAVPRSLLTGYDTQSDTDTSTALSKMPTQPAVPPLPSPAPSSPVHGADTPKANRTGGKGASPSISPSTSMSTTSSSTESRSAVTISPTTPLSFLEVENAAPKLPANHGRNASVTILNDDQPLRPALRSKKSLPDMRQSHAQILDERNSGRDSEAEGRPHPLDAVAVRRPRADSIASPAVASFPLPGPRPALSASTSYFDIRKPRQEPSPVPAHHAEGERVRQAAPTAGSTSGRAPNRGMPDAGEEGRSAGVDRHSGAYFRRLSMLPPSTISKQVPIALLQFVDAIRGILFALSQLHSALKQFVMFAMPDRLPSALSKMMANADASMSALIDALDRFDGWTRRATPTSGVVREVFEACRENVSVFGNLVGVLALQLKALTGNADIRYTRTLLLMLYGSMAEVAAAWSAIAPLAEELKTILRSANEQSASTALMLQPPTPSPKGEDVSLPAAASFRPPPVGAASTNGRPRSKSVGRRHAGSFGAEGLPSMPQHSPNASANGVPTMPSSLPSAPSSMRARPGAPKLNMQIAAAGMGSSTAATPTPIYGDLFKHLNDLPPTPIATVAPSAYSVAESPLREPGLPSVVTSTRPSPAVADTGALFDFLDMVDNTTNVALGVCSMLTQRTDVNRFTELNDLCELGTEMAKRLKEDLTRLSGVDATADHEQSGQVSSSRWKSLVKKLTATDCRQLWEDSNAFAKAVIQIASLARAVAQEAARSNSDQPFADPAREGISQLAKATNTLLSLASVAVKPPAR